MLVTLTYVKKSDAKGRTNKRFQYGGPVDIVVVDAEDSDDMSSLDHEANNSNHYTKLSDMEISLEDYVAPTASDAREHSKSNKEKRYMMW